MQIKNRIKMQSIPEIVDPYCYKDKDMEEKGTPTS